MRQHFTHYKSAGGKYFYFHVKLKPILRVLRIIYTHNKNIWKPANIPIERGVKKKAMKHQRRGYSRSSSSTRYIVIRTFPRLTTSSKARPRNLDSRASSRIARLRPADSHLPGTRFVVRGEKELRLEHVERENTDAECAQRKSAGTSLL